MELLKQIISFFTSILIVTFSLPLDAREAGTVLDDYAVFADESAGFERVRGYYGETTDILFPLTFGEENRRNILTVDERHIYSFTVPERGFISCSVAHGELQDFSGWQFVLCREYYLNGVDGETGLMPLNTLKTTAMATVEKAPNIGVMPGEYKLIVSVSSGVSHEEYGLTVDFTPSPSYEIECNDVKARYTEIYSGVPMKGSASVYENKQDTDWYLLRVQKDGKLSLSFSHETQNSISVAWRIVLYTENGEEIYSENSGMNTKQIESGEIGIPAGYYYIAVFSRVHTGVDYTLSVNTSADAYFERENNDTAGTASDILPAGSVYGCITSKNGKLDRDYFRFELPENGFFSFVFCHTPSVAPDKVTDKTEDKNGWSIRLRNESGDLLCRTVSTWNSVNVNSPEIGLAKGVYYIEVSCEDMYRNTATYTIFTGFTPSENCETEPNNTLAAANSLTAGVRAAGTIAGADEPDDDLYTFTLNTAASVSVTLRHTDNHSGREIFRFTLYNETESKIPLADGSGEYSVKNTGTQTASTGSYELSPGTYFIKVTSGQFFDTMQYTIEYNT